MDQNRTIWIVLGVVVVALVLFLLLGRNPGDDMVRTTNQMATTTEQAIDRASVRAEAAADLTALRARQEAGETYESLRNEYAEVRTRLAAAYENAEGEAREEWTELSADFDQFEADARAGTGNVLDALARIISNLSADVRVETSAE